jgi:hypothetical protein
MSTDMHDRTLGEVEAAEKALDVDVGVGAETWLEYSPADKDPADRLGCLAHIARHHERNGDNFKAGLWGATLRREIAELGKVITVELTGEVSPPAQVIRVREAQWEAAQAERRASNVRRHALSLRGEDPEILRNCYGVEDAAPFEREARTACRRAESLRTRSTRLHRKALTRSSSTSRPQGRRSTRRTVRSSARSGDSGDDPPESDPEDLARPCKDTERTCCRCRKQRQRERGAQHAVAIASVDDAESSPEQLTEKIDSTFGPSRDWPGAGMGFPTLPPPLVRCAKTSQ